VHTELPAGAAARRDARPGPAGNHYRIAATGSGPTTRDHYGAGDGAAGVVDP
jgi:hypothetical protein